MTVQSVVITGGTGFLGTAIVRRLADAGVSVVVPTRDRARGAHLGAISGVQVVEADIHAPGVLTTLFSGADAVVNLVGILHSKPGEPWGPDFDRAHVELPRKIVAACKAAEIKHLVHISALGADADAPSEYQRSKAAGESAVRTATDAPTWTILRPSVMFGPGDSFLNLFAGLVRLFPILPLAGATARFQPVHVEDVAKVVVRCLDDEEARNKTFELAGPRVYSLRELVEYVCVLTGKRRLVIPLPEGLAMIQAAVMERLPKPLMSRDNVRSMRADNVTRGDPLPFGLEATPLEKIAPGYITARGARS